MNLSFLLIHKLTTNYYFLLYTTYFHEVDANMIIFVQKKIVIRIPCSYSLEISFSIHIFSKNYFANYRRKFVNKCLTWYKSCELLRIIVGISSEILREFMCCMNKEGWPTKFFFKKSRLITNHLRDLSKI